MSDKKDSHGSGGAANPNLTVVAVVVIVLCVTALTLLPHQGGAPGGFRGTYSGSQNPAVRSNHNNVPSNWQVR